MIFIEAIAGWLGSRCTPRLTIKLPTCDALVEAGSSSSASTEVRINIGVDWTRKPDQQVKLLLDLARGGATACRLLADILRNGTADNPAEASHRKDESDPVIARSPRPTLFRPESVVNTPRSEMDQHVERAFDLLGHYQGFVCKTVQPDEDDFNQVPPGLETAIERWLPLAAGADCKLVNDVLAIVGDNDAAASLLGDADLHRERYACLDRLASNSIPLDDTPAQATARCQQEIENWVSLMPHITIGINGKRHVTLSDKLARSADGTFWSCDLTTRHSRIGASFFLSRACEAVAHAASRDGVAKSELRPLINLGHRLQQNPDWSRLMTHEIAPIVDEQMQLIDEVELLLREIELPESGPRTRSHKPLPTPTNQFISKGHNTWEVRFQDGAEFILRGKGASYLHHLLLRQGRPARATLLQSLVAGQNEALVQSGAGTGSNGDALQVHERHLNELDEAKRDAEKNGDEAEAARVHKEMVALAKRAQSDQEALLAHRQKKDPDKKARQAVAKAIKSALDDIARESPELAKHLEKPTLQLGTSLIYSPNEETRWAL